MDGVLTGCWFLEPCFETVHKHIRWLGHPPHHYRIDGCGCIVQIDRIILEVREQHGNVHADPKMRRLDQRGDEPHQESVWHDVQSSRGRLALQLDPFFQNSSK